MLGSFFKGAIMTHRLLVSAVLLASLTGCTAANRDDSDANEVVVTMDQLPAPVREGFTREAGADATIGEIEREQETRGTVYEADVTGADGQKWEITLDDSGKLLSREKDDEEGGKDDDN
jgi:hypothetical protein